MKKILYIMAFSSLALLSCEKDEITRPDGSLWEKAETTGQTEGSSDLKVNTELFDLKVNEVESFDIVEGNGEYKLTVLDPNIAEASLQDNTITVKGLKQGTTEVVISDKSMNYKNIKINVYITDNLVIDKPEGIKISLPLGNPKSQDITVVEGNGNYEAIPENAEFVSTSVQGNTITITGLKAAQTNVILKDSRGLTVTIPVTIEEIDSPYSDEELEEFKKLTTKAYYNDWIGYTLITQKSKGFWTDGDFKYYTYNGNNWGMSKDQFGWAIYSKDGSKLKESFGLIFGDKTTDGHRTLGEKENVTFEYINEREDDNHIEIKDIPAKFEVIKVDESEKLIWVVWSAEYNETLYYGKFIMPNYAE